MKKVLITGTGGFIGFHLAKLLLKEGHNVHGYDGMTDYYDVNLKKARRDILQKNSNFDVIEGMLEDNDKLDDLANKFQPDVIVHLAAQAGVRYSLENPRAYIDSNIIGTFNVMEVARKYKVKHLLMASTSSVFGANTKMPFTEIEKADTQLTIYAATKKANESMAHSYAYLWKIPTTMLRFFTVYGPWGRPDMALFKFVSAILNNKPIDIYNNGEMYRDFTYIDDLVNGIKSLIDAIPSTSTDKNISNLDSLSNVAPYRVVNIGNSSKIRLLDFIEAIEEVLGKKAIRNHMPMQKGDVSATWADTSLLRSLTGDTPQTNFKVGIASFIEWYRGYYNV
ncbi:SDR family NAD(P)-dependent oxidoreductase [Pelagibacteraceae bacterium]|jgi:UDP-glucuronate 4-epimerase|nr:SDR family NAD(P)-dependent oxidoreductase [Pelagibacteraceae bacterium]|tara:strand:- start:2240 stop:3250 length:1011 start_codon:yes stop_codon:yes gene_type:complete